MHNAMNRNGDLPKSSRILFYILFFSVHFFNKHGNNGVHASQKYNLRIVNHPNMFHQLITIDTLW